MMGPNLESNGFLRTGAIAVRSFLAIFATLTTACTTALPHRGELIDHGLIIEDVTLISPERDAPLVDADVVIVDDRITAVGTNFTATGQARRIDGRGRYLIPGLIDSHVHVGHPIILTDEMIDEHPEFLTEYRKQTPKSFLYYGYTTLIDLDFKAAHGAWWNDSPIHPDLFHCGRGVRIAGGYGPSLFPPEVAYKIFPNLVYEPTQKNHWPASLDPAEYTPAKAVARAVDAGAICLKTYYQTGLDGNPVWPVASSETLGMLRAESKSRKIPLVMHATEVAGYRAAIDAGADVIAHGLWHWPGDKRDPRLTAEVQAVIEHVAKSRIHVQPTLQVIFGEKDTYTWELIKDPHLVDVLPPSLLELARTEPGQASRRQLQKIWATLSPNAETPASVLLDALQERVTRVLTAMNEANVPLLFGTDTPSSEGIGNPPGLNGRLEMQRWIDAGVPLQKILYAATLGNARAFQLDSQVGTIEPGKRANLLLLKQDPLKDLQAYDAIEFIILGGQPISRDMLSAVRKEKP